ncbi:MAG: DUF4255 domain-containing protein [Microscillaceae bacterium]|nr:DUF4255 domain-containing protein [Microscillaceae bacterium]
MIYFALKTISESLNTYIKNRFSLSKDKVILSEVIDKDSQEAATDKDKIALTLINIQQEKNINKTSHATSTPAPLHLNLFLMFSVYFGEDGSYEESLKELSAVISFFQAKHVFNHQNTPDLHHNIDKLVFEFLNHDLQNLSYIWGMLGGKYVPSVMYKVRMITIQEGSFDNFPPVFTGFGSGNF